MLKKFFRELDMIGIKFHLFSGKTLKKKNIIWWIINNYDRNNFPFIDRNIF